MNEAWMEPETAAARAASECRLKLLNLKQTQACKRIYNTIKQKKNSKCMYSRTDNTHDLANKQAESELGSESAMFAASPNVILLND